MIDAGLEVSKVAIFTLGLDGTLLRFNPAFAELVGRNPDDLVGLDILSITHPDDIELTAEALRAAREGRLREVQVEKRYVRPDGHIVQALIFGSVVPEAEGRQAHWFRIAIDVSEQRRAHDDLAAQNRLLERIAGREPLSEVLDEVCRSIEERSPGARCSILLLNPDGRTVRHGAAPSLPRAYVRAVDGAEIGPEAGSCGTAMYTRAEVVVEDISLHPFWRDWKEVALPHGLRACWSTPILSSNQAGARKRVWGSFAVYWNQPRGPTERDRRLVTRVTDLATIAIERDDVEQSLVRSGLTDPLTGLPNRRQFSSRLIETLARAQRSKPTVAVLYVDIDNFKLVNDSMGHEMADTLLKEAGSRLLGVLRPHDLLARIGGDEFTIICENVDGYPLAQQLAERARLVLAAPFQIGEREIFITASVGVAVGAARDPAAKLVDNADSAMYRAKQHGKNRCEIFDPSMHARAVDRLRTEGELRRALGESELKVFFQPIMHLETQAITGFEALLRWAHPTRGLLAPAAFLDIAEDSNQIVAIGKEVLTQVCMQAVTWQGQWSAPELTVSYNLSLRQLYQGDFPQTLADILAGTGLDPTTLLLEVTESVLFDATRSAVVDLSALEGQGVQIGIDDFGTGYSSLSYLRQFRVGFVKIDQSFVGGLDHSPRDVAIVEAIIRLCQTLDLTIVAEGIETPAQLEMLRSLGCTHGQGYHIGRPQPPEAASRLFGPQVAHLPELLDGGGRPTGVVSRPG